MPSGAVACYASTHTTGRALFFFDRSKTKEQKIKEIVRNRDIVTVSRASIVNRYQKCQSDRTRLTNDCPMPKEAEDSHVPDGAAGSFPYNSAV